MRYFYILCDINNMFFYYELGNFLTDFFNVKGLYNFIFSLGLQMISFLHVLGFPKNVLLEILICFTHYLFSNSLCFAIIFIDRLLLGFIKLFICIFQSFASNSQSI